MKYKGYLLLSVLSIVLFSKTKAGNLYNRSIIANAKVYAVCKDAIEDVRQNLKNATGVDFMLEQDDAKTEGIHLYLLSEGDNSPAIHRLQPNQPDDVWMQSDGEHALNIYAYYKQGLINGLYTYLDTLGFRFYHPGDAWTITPHLTNIQLKWDNVLKPDFTLRNFFGTYGTPRNAAIDRNEDVTKMWTLWQMRNRFASGYVLRGHAGNDFLKRHMGIFIQHPEYTAEVDGKRTGYQTAAKLCVSNPELRKLFVDDMVEQLRKDIAEHPNYSVHCVSAEPSDGEGECTCAACRKMGSVSDRVFYMANLAAIEFRKIAPNAYVNLYAYNTHAAPPLFSLEPNVIVQIIPYGYQTYASADEMIAAWRSKAKEMFIYDYYGLPIANLDMPLQGTLRAEGLANKIKLWHTQNINGITLESSYSIGATGLGLYIFARLSWKASLDPQAIIKEYYTQCYGKLAPAMQHIRQTLETDSTDRVLSLNRGYTELRKNYTNMDMQGDVKKRVELYEVYLHYLKTYYDLKNANSTEQIVNGVDTVMRFVYSTFYTMMVHNYPISEYVKSISTPAVKEYVAQNWDCYKPMDPRMKFSTLTQLNGDQIESVFNRDANAMPALNIPDAPIKKHNMVIPFKANRQNEYLRMAAFHANHFILRTDASGQFKFRYVKHHASPSIYTFSMSFTSKGKAAVTKSYTSSADTIAETVALQPNTEYDIDYYSNGPITLYIPYNTAFFTTPSKGDYYYTYIYAHVPTNLNKVLISIGDSKGLNIKDNTGHYLKVKNVYDNIYELAAEDIPANRIIGLNSERFSQIRFLNMDNIFSLRDDVMPAEK